jgi:formamidopyrimidine-DNA glycosylase
MPELPEVETVRRSLEPAIGARIASVWTSGKPLRLNRSVPKAALTRALVGRAITALRRHGKYLLVDVDGPHALLVHLGMTGSLRLYGAGAPREKHTHVVFALGDGRELRYADPRRFGQIDVVERAREREHASLAVLGPDPLVGRVDGAYLYEKSRRRATSLKSFLLDQSNLAGVGNIYAAEALWRARLKPSRRARGLTREEATSLARAVRTVFDHALKRGGTTLSDFVDGSGQAGENADYLVVYGRAGEPCRRCKSPIRRTIIQGRATYFCPTCQVT